VHASLLVPANTAIPKSNLSHPRRRRRFAQKKLGKNAGELTAFLGTLTMANGTYNHTSPSSQIVHVAEDGAGTLYGYGIIPNPGGDGGPGNTASYFVRIDPATATMTALTTTPIANQPAQINGFSPGTSGGTRFAVLDASNHLWCVDASGTPSASPTPSASAPACSRRRSASCTTTA
jgi:hypothetical protein